MRRFTPRELIEGYIRAGVDLYIDGKDDLHIRAPKPLRDAARPAILSMKPELIEELKVLRAESVERLLATLGDRAGLYGLVEREKEVA